MTAVQLRIDYETLVTLVEQLSETQQQDLVRRLLKKTLTAGEKLTFLQNIQYDIPVNEEPSIRREDWYDDDGR